jgi:heme-degrading monooxygenase HmoA
MALMPDFCTNNINRLFDIDITMAEGPITEILNFRVKPDSTEGINKLWTYLQKMPGFRGGAWGYQAEGETENGAQVAFGFFGWDSLQAQKDFVTSPIFAEFKEEGKAIIAETPKIKLIPNDKSNPLKVGDHAEIVKAVLPGGADPDEFQKDAWHGLKAILPSFKGYKAHTAGAVIDTPGEYLLLLNWESVDAYKAATQAEDAKATMAKVKAAAQEVKVSHVTITATIAGH